MHNLKQWLFKYKEIILFLFILSLSSFLRFYKVPELFVFSTDEEYGFFLADTIVKNFHIIWIGESAANTGFYMGPFWVYFTAFWLYLSGGNPQIPAYVVAALGVLTTLAVFTVARSIFNLRVAAVASLLYACLPLIVFFDRKYWLLSPAPLASILLVYFLYLTKKSLWWYMAVGFVYGMVFHVHLSLVPFGVVIVYWFWLQREKILRVKKIIVLFILSFLMAISPLIVFDYFHKGSNLLTPLRIRQAVAQKTDTIDPLRHFNNLFISLGRLWYLAPNRPNADEVLHACSPYYLYKDVHKSGITTFYTSPPFLLSFFSLLLLGWFFLNLGTWKKENTRLIALPLLLILLAFIFFPNVPLEYYLVGTFPLFLFIPGILADAKNKIIVTTFILIAVIFSSLGIFTIFTAKGDFGLATKARLVKKVMSYIKEGKFEIREDGLCHTNGGWRYLFKYYGRKPERSPVDHSIGYLFPDEISKQPVGYTVVMSEARIPSSHTKNNPPTFSEGGFRAYIYKR